MSDLMSNDDGAQLSELLLRWEESFERGRELSAATLCEDCPHLLEPLEQQIRHLRSLQPMLDTRQADSQDTGGSPGSATRLPLPSHVATEGRYEVVRLHATGGKGQIHVARDLLLQRDVAIKCAHPEFAGSSYSSRRLMREAEITARLKHPGIVPVHSIGQDEHGRPFYCMQLVAGETMRESIARFHDLKTTDHSQRRLQFRQLLRHFIDVCDTMAYAHSQQVIHRDIKPENILIGSYGETFVVDWGLAKDQTVDDEQSQPVDEQPPATDSFTQEGSALGTPGYMSPEQATGQSTTHASDIFNLGATLYAVLTGQRPYQSERLIDVMEAASRAEFPRPGSMNRHLSATLESICLKAMAKDPAQRYAAAKDLGADLERWLADEPVSVHRESATERLARWSRRHRTLAAAAVIVLLVTTLTLGLSTFLIGREQNKTQKAWTTAEQNFIVSEEHRKTAAKNFERALAAVDRFFVLVSENKLLHVPGMQPLRQELLLESLEYYEHFLADEADNPRLLRELAKAHERVARILREIGSRPVAAEHLEQAIALRTRILAESPDSSREQLALAIAHNQNVELLFDLAQWDAAEASLQAALDLARKALPDASVPAQAEEELAYILMHSGNLHMHRGQNDLAVSRHREAYRICQSLMDRNVDRPLKELAYQLHYNIANCERLRGEYDAALASYWDSVSVAEQLAHEHPQINRHRADLADSLNQIAFIERQRNNVDAAIQVLQRGRDELESLVKADPDVHEYQNDLGVLYTELGRLLIESDVEAADHLLTMAAAIRQTLADDNPGDIEFRFNAGAALCSLALLEMQEGRFVDAQGHFQQALDRFHAMDQDTPNDPQIRNGLACIYQELGNAYQGSDDWEQARAARQQSLDLFGELHQAAGSVLTEISVTQTSAELAGTLCLLGRSQEALDVLTVRCQQLIDSPYLDTPSNDQRQQLSAGMAALSQAAVAAEAPALVFQIVDARSRLAANDPDVLYECGRSASWCSARTDDPATQERYARQAIDWLREALAAGFDDGDRLQNDPRLEPIRSREEFAALLASLQN